MLPANAKPLNYNLNLDVDLKNFKYVGDETIQIEIKEETDKIILNSIDLEITRCKIILKDETLTPKIKIDKEKEELVLQFEKKIPAGTCELYIAFEGKITDKLSGLYKSKYTTKDGEIKYLATTQFEPADARRMFPCFDEPASKATFELSVTADKKFEMISNMPAKSEEKIGKDKRKVFFEKTPLMSTYLLYLGIGEFEFLEDKYNNVALRFACTKGKKKQGAFAIDLAKKFLSYYEEYFGAPYQLPKLDLVAAPDFAFGAMENWGAITFREVELIYDAKSTSTAIKQSIAYVIAHELVHQWFGDLVTMKWWNDLWLNESFATWLAYKALDRFFPEWDVWARFTKGRMIGAFGLDALKTSHPIEANVKDPHELNEIFDAISYDKGACVLRMLESHIGEDAFKAGLQRYIAGHKYKNTETKNLWAALEASSKAPVAKLMAGWTAQVGFPIIDAKLEGQKLILLQKRFLLEPDKERESSWLIPINGISDSGEKISVIMDSKKKEIQLKQKAKWVKLNAGQAGFYKIKYDKNLLAGLKTAIREKKLSALDRWGIQADVFSIAKAAEIPFSDYLDLAKAYLDEDDFVVRLDVLQKLGGIYELATGKFREQIRPVAEEYCKRLFSVLGWDRKRGEKENDAILRAAVISQLGRFDDNLVLAEALKRFEDDLAGRKKLIGDLRSPVYKLVAWQGDASTQQRLIGLYESAELPEEKLRFLSALGQFKQKDILDKTLDFALSPPVRNQDLIYPVASVADNSFGTELIWPWFKKNFSELVKRFLHGHSTNMFGELVEALDGLSSLEAEKEIKAFFEKNPCKGVEMKIAQTLETIRINHRFLEFNSK